MIKAPLQVMVGNKAIPISLNHYRNGYHHQLNKAKILYKEYVANQLKGLILVPPVTLLFVYFAPDKRVRDLGNMLAIHEKYFSDALVELGCLPDDSYEFINEIVYKFGAICKENPRVEIEIKSSIAI